ncbi:hypothetical protein JCM18549_00260 [Halolamina salina]
MTRIVVIDNHGQFTHLEGRALRDIGVDTETTALCRPFSDRGAPTPPEDDQIIPFDLEGVEYGDKLELYRLPASERPAYPEANDDEKELVTDGGAREETIENWLVINWREGTTRTRKSKPDAAKLGTHELATSLTLNVTIPDVDVPELVADVEVPQPRVEASELSDLETEDSPDWMDVADEIVDEHPETDPFDEIDQLVVAVLEDTPGRPDVEEVKRYLQQQLRELQRGENQ